MKEIKHKNIIIYGGAGWIGQQLIERLYDYNNITVYSRDESKHHKLRTRFPKIKSILGDVNNKDKVIKSTRGHDISINLAAIKQIHVAQEEPEEAVNTIINGALNTKEAAIENKLMAACLISSDKACAPSNNVYGCAKSIAECIYVNNNDNELYPAFSVCRYGNVAASVNSILYNLPGYIKNKKEFTLFHPEMTRFNILAREAIDLIIYSITSCSRDEIIIPDLKSYRIEDLLKIYNSKFGLKYVLGEPRTGEKIHELLFSEEESHCIIKCNESGFFKKTKRRYTYENHSFIDIGERTSKDFCMSKDELEEFLIENRFFIDNE